MYGLSAESWFKQSVRQDLAEQRAEQERGEFQQARSRVSDLLSGRARMTNPWQKTVEKRPVFNEGR